MLETIYRNCAFGCWALVNAKGVCRYLYDLKINKFSYEFVIDNDQLYEKGLIEPWQDTWIITEELAEWLGENTRLFETQVNLYYNKEKDRVFLVIVPLFREDFDVLCKNYTNDKK